MSLYIQWNESSDARTCTPSRTLLKPAIDENRKRPTGHTWRFWPIATIAQNRQVCRWLLTDKLVPITSLHKKNNKQNTQVHQYHCMNIFEYTNLSIYNIQYLKKKINLLTNIGLISVNDGYELAMTLNP